MADRPSAIAIQGERCPRVLRPASRYCCDARRRSTHERTTSLAEAPVLWDPARARTLEARPTYVSRERSRASSPRLDRAAERRAHSPLEPLRNRATRRGASSAACAGRPGRCTPPANPRSTRAVSWRATHGRGHRVHRGSIGRDVERRRVEHRRRIGCVRGARSDVVGARSERGGHEHDPVRSHR